MRRAIKSVIVSVLVAVTPLLAFAHGEDKPGPHGGVIRMPGGFHTELKARGRTGFDVFLLDMEWANPVVAGSTLEAFLKTRAGRTKLSCAPRGDRFACDLPRGQKLKKGDIAIVRANRQGLPGSEALYPYPFRVELGGDHHHGH